MAHVASGRKQAFFGPVITDAQGNAQWSVDGDAFDGVQIGLYWSATPFSDTRAWFVSSFSGTVLTDLKATALFVWPVRGPGDGVAVAELDFDPATQVELDTHAGAASAHHTPTVDTVLNEGQVETFVTNGPLDGSQFTNLSGGSITAGSVAEAQIANGAVSAAKLGIANTIYIEDNGVATTNCTALLAALTGLSGPAAVVLGPGTYDCEANVVVIPASVSLIGSGQNLTTITGSLDDAGFGLVRLQGDDASLHNLTVINDRPGFPALPVAVSVFGADNFRIGDVTARAMNGAITRGVAIYGDACDGWDLSSVTTTASGGVTSNTALFIGCSTGSGTGTNVTAIASGASSRGVFLANGSASVLRLRDSLLKGTSASADKQPANTLTVISSELDGAVIHPVVCVGAYDENGVALADGTNGSGGCV